MSLIQKNPLQSYAEQTSVGNSLASLGIVTVSLDCPIHGIQQVQTFAFRQNGLNAQNATSLLKPKNILKHSKWPSEKKP